MTMAEHDLWYERGRAAFRARHGHYPDHLIPPEDTPEADAFGEGFADEHSDYASSQAITTGF